MHQGARDSAAGGGDGGWRCLLVNGLSDMCDVEGVGVFEDGIKPRSQFNRFNLQ